VYHVLLFCWLSVTSVWSAKFSCCLCLIQNREQFVDDSFPPIGRSLHYDGSCGKVAQWLRLNHVRLYNKEDERLSWTVFSSPKPSDICQGVLGNCWWAFFWLYACTILFEFEILFKVISIGHYLTAVLGGLGSASSLKILLCRFQNWISGLRINGAGFCTVRTRNSILCTVQLSFLWCLTNCVKALKGTQNTIHTIHHQTRDKGHCCFSAGSLSSCGAGKWQRSLILIDSLLCLYAKVSELVVRSRRASYTAGINRRDSRVLSRGSLSSETV